MNLDFSDKKFEKCVRRFEFRYFVNICTIVESRYSSALTTNDRMYGRPGQINSDYYYKTMQIVVERNGIYYIKSLSDMDTLGFLYDGTFNPLNSDSNIYQQDDDSGENSQFQIAAYLQAGVPYTLVFTTFSPRTTGSFSLVATGPGNVQYNSTGSIVTTPRELLVEFLYIIFVDICSTYYNTISNNQFILF